MRRRAAWALAWAALLLTAVPQTAAETRLPRRIRRVVLHTPGGPAYGHPERRWLFFPPPQTHALWRPAFGAHWIVWTDGTIWPRHHGRAEPELRVPPADGSIDAVSRRWIARGAEPVYAQLHGANGDSVGIEVSHSGRTQDAFPEAQIRSLVWLLHGLIEMSEGRLSSASITGHRDLDRRPAYVSEACERPGCAIFVDDAGRPYRRRVDPPESLFRSLAEHGLEIPREGREGDVELLRAETLPAGARPAASRSLKQ